MFCVSGLNCSLTLILSTCNQQNAICTAGACLLCTNLSTKASIPATKSSDKSLNAEYKKSTISKIVRLLLQLLLASKQAST